MLGRRERQLNSITTAEEARAALSSGHAVLFKHSTRCPVSSYAYREVSAFLGRHPEAPVLLVDVLASRELSRWIATETGVAHESPQLLVVRNGVVAFTASHEGITVEVLEREAL